MLSTDIPFIQQINDMFYENSYALYISSIITENYILDRCEITYKFM